MKINGFIEIDETSEEFDEIRETIKKDLIRNLKSELEMSDVIDILMEFEKGSSGPSNLCEILKTVTTNITTNHTTKDYYWNDAGKGFKKLLAIKEILDI